MTQFAIVVYIVIALVLFIVANRMRLQGQLGSMRMCVVLGLLMLVSAATQVYFHN
ncbi:MAG: hypothetical protein JWO58_3346 [Chitinophagaceae bacterium]|nr:hypothetical protein [Chitinophagaceae bacterium]